MLDRFMRQKQNDAAIEVCIEEKKKKNFMQMDANGQSMLASINLLSA